MFPLMFIAIAAGLGTAAAVAPTSIALAVVSAPFGGSFAAFVAGLYIAHRNGTARERPHPDATDHTDSMVAALRSLEIHDRARTRPPAAEPDPKRHVA